MGLTTAAVVAVVAAAVAVAVAITVAAVAAVAATVAATTIAVAPASFPSKSHRGWYAGHAALWLLQDNSKIHNPPLLNGSEGLYISYKPFYGNFLHPQPQGILSKHIPWAGEILNPKKALILAFTSRQKGDSSLHRDFIGHPVQVQVDGFAHLQGGFDIQVGNHTVLVYYHPVPLALFKQVYRVVAHLAGHQPFPGSRGSTPLDMPQDGSAGGDAGALLDVVAHFSGIPHPFRHDDDKVMFP